MRKWIMRTFTVVVIRQPAPNTPRRKPKSPLEKAAVGAVYLGLAIAAAGGIYDIRTYRSSPNVPDATHVVLRESHGDRRYKTREQVQLSNRLSIGGMSIFGAGALVLFITDWRDKHAASKQGKLSAGSDTSTPGS
jgi:hypothetical protein